MQIIYYFNAYLFAHSCICLQFCFIIVALIINYIKYCAYMFFSINNKIILMTLTDDDDDYDESYSDKWQYTAVILFIY